MAHAMLFGIWEAHSLIDRFERISNRIVLGVIAAACNDGCGYFLLLDFFVPWRWVTI